MMKKTETMNSPVLCLKRRKKNFQEVLLEEFKEDRKSRDQFQKKLENFMETLMSIEKSKLEKI